MFSPTLLLTSFQTWKPEQRSNSSDELLTDISPHYPHLSHLKLLRRLPVDFQLAPEMVIHAIQAHAPDAIICCGMGETRSHLCIEDRATEDSRIRNTDVNVKRLVSGLPMTRISHDAGQFVCNRLYFEVLNYLQYQGPDSSPCIFVHVPVLTDGNRTLITADFQAIILRIQLLIRRSAHRPFPSLNPCQRKLRQLTHLRL